MDNESGKKNVDSHMITVNDMTKEFKEACKVIGMEKALELAKAMGGERLYVPKFETLVRNVKQAAIRREFDGKNYRELAKKYDYSVRWIRMIVNQAD